MVGVCRLCYAFSMSTKSNPRKDLNETAFSIMQQATGEVEPAKPTKAQETGREGGLKGGKARAAKLTPEQRAEIAKKAATTRWEKRATEQAVTGRSPAKKKVKVSV